MAVPRRRRFAPALAFLRDAEQVKSEKDLGIKELSVADWRKIFKFSSKNGKTIISGYVGDSTDVLIPEKIGANAVTEIREGAFKKDSKIQTMVIEAGIKTIPKEAFVWSSMTSIELPPALTKIDTNAFCHSTQLRKIVLPPKTKVLPRVSSARTYWEYGVPQIR